MRLRLQEEPTQLAPAGGFRRLLQADAEGQIRRTEADADEVVNLAQVELPRDAMYAPLRRGDRATVGWSMLFGQALAGSSQRPLRCSRRSSSWEGWGKSGRSSPGRWQRAASPSWMSTGDR